MTEHMKILNEMSTRRLMELRDSGRVFQGFLSLVKQEGQSVTDSDILVDTTVAGGVDAGHSKRDCALW